MKLGQHEHLVLGNRPGENFSSPTLSLTHPPAMRNSTFCCFTWYSSRAKASSAETSLSSSGMSWILLEGEDEEEDEDEDMVEVVDLLLL